MTHAIRAGKALGKPRTWCQLVFFGVSLAVASPDARAQPLAEARTQVLLLDPQVPELVARVRGQTRDLPLTLVLLDAGPTSLSTSTQSELSEQRASALATERGCQLAVWLNARVDSGYDISVLQVPARSLHVRQVPAARSQDVLARSATFEAVALVVRAELADALQPPIAATRRTAAEDGAVTGKRAAGANGSALAGAGAADRADAAADGAPGVSASAAVSSRPAASDPAVSSDSAAADRAGTPRSLRPQLVANAGWELALAGTDYLTDGFSGALGVELARLRLSAGVVLDLPYHSSDSHAQLRLQRQVFALSASLRLLELRGWALRAGLGAELMRLGRETRSRDPLYISTPASELLSAALGLDLRLDWLPCACSHGLGLELALGADVVPWAPRYVYQLGDQLSERATAAYFEPRATLGLLLVL